MSLVVVDILLIFFLLLFSVLVFQSIKVAGGLFKFVVFLVLSAVFLTTVFYFEFDIKLDEMSSTGYVVYDDICEEEGCEERCEKRLYRMVCQDICDNCLMADD